MITEPLLRICRCSVGCSPPKVKGVFAVMKVMNGLIREFLRTSHFVQETPPCRGLLKPTGMHSYAASTHVQDLNFEPLNASPHLQPAGRPGHTPWTPKQNHALARQATAGRTSEACSDHIRLFSSPWVRSPAVCQERHGLQVEIGTLLGCTRFAPLGRAPWGGWHFWLVRCSARQMLPADCCGWRR